ncbi:hypothetical protein L1987_11900 [Smallanthus sonchifolius]|uniref:Uncharacterized protein n=1 Tax=Smallanthus sonchifolius TaxID=185202 RepID=A0ACB9JFN6_9ASTR|nr:hypothetical protein L1987_11900 [Smallanthus sonchifolius]
MPPSPAMRCSPGREPRGDNHKRGHSFESTLPLKQRDDDLALFNEVQSREKDNFLLQADDDFEDIFTSKLRYFSDYKLGINIPARGESSDLLHAEEEKNDYEWLLTPPDTPLFPSLDDEVPQVNLAQRGRPRTQPISISRSSTMEKSHRSSRGSASPNRVSLSPRSHNSPFESRGVRAMSAPSASPPTTLKPSTSSLRSSPPSRKPVTPIPRASTPTSRRLSTGSNSSTTSSRGSRGNSPSPKVKAWQASIPGFSSEVPPNLRTSLADRPASYVRGSSPASRNSRQSMSPTASRSIGSSHSKGSVGSSADDDMESFSSVIVSGGTQRLNSRRVGGLQNNNKRPHPQFSKKPSRTVSSSSAPKRSFDLALRQMDHRKGPQNMFRPLLSSVPSSTFHVGISTSPHNTMISRNSSVTTSSNPSSGPGLGGVQERKPETGLDDATSGPVKVQNRDDSDEMFVIEKDDGLNESCEPTTLTAGLTYDGIGDINSQTGLLICSKCGCWFSPIGLENDTNLCGECIESYSPLTIVDPVIESATTVDPQVAIVEVKSQSSQHDDLVKDSQSTYAEPIWNFLAQNSLSRSRSEECETKQVNHDMVEFSKSKVDSLEGAGISLLLKRSSSMKGTVVRNMTFSASSISYDDFSYARDSTNNNSMRSMSVSSSADFSGVNRQPDTRFQRQSSSTKSEIESYKFGLNNAKHNRSGSSLSGTSSHACHNEENNTSTPENNNGNEFQTGPIQTHVDSGESLLTDSTKVEEAAEFQKIEGSGCDDTRASETCTLEDCTDVDKVQSDAVSGEFDQPGRVSPGSTSSIEELQEVVPDKDHDTPNHTSNIIEESIVVVKHEGEMKGRSLTLEEATDTILFCSSIVHNLAQRAATIAIEKEMETRLDPMDDGGSWPLIPAARKSDIGPPGLQTQTTTKRPSKSHRSRQKKEAETDLTKTPNTAETKGQTGQPKTRIVGVRDLNNGESKKPPMLESKCNCIIM